MTLANFKRPSKLHRATRLLLLFWAPPANLPPFSQPPDTTHNGRINHQAKEYAFYNTHLFLLHPSLGRNIPTDNSQQSPSRSGAPPVSATRLRKSRPPSSAKTARRPRRTQSGAPSSRRTPASPTSSPTRSVCCRKSRTSAPARKKRPASAEKPPRLPGRARSRLPLLLLPPRMAWRMSTAMNSRLMTTT